MERPTCATCPYWEKDSVDGRCHRYPPEDIAFDIYKYVDGGSVQWGDAGSSDDFGFRVVPVYGWCGEHPDFPAYLFSIRGEVTTR
jgi:hypothetical protein